MKIFVHDILNILNIFSSIFICIIILCIVFYDADMCKSYALELFNALENDNKSQFDLYDYRAPGLYFSMIHDTKMAKYIFPYFILLSGILRTLKQSYN